MTRLGHARAMALNNAWSNHRLLKACAKLSDADYKARRVSFFPSIHLTLNHILIVDWYYMDALEAGGLGTATLDSDTPCDTFVALNEAQRASDRRLLSFCTRLDEAALDATVVLDRGPNGRFEERVHAVLDHLFVHDIHHRGQVHAMLAGTPAAPPQLDEFFLDQDRPVRAEDLRTLASLGYPGL